MNAPVEQVITHFTEYCTPILAPGGEPVHSSERITWLESRQTMVTASDVAAILGLDPMRDALSVFLSKRYPVKKETLTWEDPRFWGLELEQAIGRIVAKYCDWEFHPGGYLLRSNEHPVLGATLDAEVRPANENWRPYEGKNVSTWAAQDWDASAQTPPDRVLIQAQTQMMVTGADAVQTFALLGGNQPCSVEVAPSIELRELILEKAYELTERLKRDDPYPATRKSTEAIKSAFPGDDGSIIQLDQEACDLVEASARLSRKISDLEEDNETLRNQLKMMMGRATFGRLPSQVPVKRKRLDETKEDFVEYVKWGTSYKPPSWSDERTSRSLFFVKNLPKHLQPRQGRR